MQHTFANTFRPEIEVVGDQYFANTFGNIGDTVPVGVCVGRTTDVPSASFTVVAVLYLAIIKCH